MLGLIGLSIPIRWQLMMVLCTATMTVYIMRISMSVAALEMSIDLNWSTSQLGLILSAYYWGYAAGQIPSILLAKKYGGTIVLGISVVGSAMLTPLIPVVSRMSFGMILFLQAVVGVIQSMAFPSCYWMYPRWMPVSERTLMVAFVVSGVFIGQIVGLVMSGMLVNSPSVKLGTWEVGRWDSCFYASAAFGFIWFPFYYYFTYDCPSEHPRMTDEEYDFIRKGSGFMDSSTVSTIQFEDDANQRHFSLSRESFHANPRDTTTIAETDNPMLTSVDDCNGDIEIGERALVIDKDKCEHNGSAYNGLSLSETSPTAVCDTCGCGQTCDHNCCETKAVMNPMILSTTINPPTAIPVRARRATTSASDIGLPPGRLHHHYHTHHPHHLNFHSIPWKAMFTNSACLALLLNSFAAGCIGLTLMAEMPAFMNQQLGMNIRNSGLLSAMPYLCNYMSVEGFSIFFDHCMRHRGWSKRNVRQWANRVGLLLPGVCIVILGYVTDGGTGVFLLCLTLSFYGAIQSGTPCGYMDISPNHSSEINTVGNVIASCAGFLAPVILSGLQENYPGALGWQIFFYMILSLVLVAIIVWYFYNVTDIIPELNGAPEIMPPMPRHRTVYSIQDAGFKRQNSLINSTIFRLALSKDEC